MKVALKAAIVCIEAAELDIAVKVLERAADYQEVLGKRSDGDGEQGEKGQEEEGVGDRLRMEYYAVRTTLVSFADVPLVHFVSEVDELTMAGVAAGPARYRGKHVRQV